MRLLFWVSVAGIVYPYAGYPVLLSVLGRLRRRPALPVTPTLPTVSMIVPVHNEGKRIAAKLANTAALDYPAERIEVLFVSDGSTDDTAEFIRRGATPRMTLIEMPQRGGKAAALNAGLANARHEILVFTDASIMLETGALRAIVRQFQDPAVGCVSGEDRIADGGGEGLYGRYELWLRRLESDVASIVGASGSFYAQRRSLCRPFAEGMAPDFLSVLRTVEQGARAVTDSTAIGAMTSLKDPRLEFERKVRTLIRGLTTLFAHPHLLNPFRFGTFAFLLGSHKLLRWTVPFFLVGALVSAAVLWQSPLFLAALMAQVLAYAVAYAAYRQWGGLQNGMPGKVALYFVSANVSILVAWIRYFQGVRQELWTPSAR